jgi:hypothetical protein
LFETKSVQVALVTAGVVSAVLFFAAPAAGPQASAGEMPAGSDYGAAAAGCDVTEPSAVVLPGALLPAWRIQSQGLSVGFGEQSTFAVSPNGEEAPGTYPAHLRRGEILNKLPWFRARGDREARGMLRVKATSRTGQRARTRYTNHLGPNAPVIPGFMAFPHEGCWKVVGRSGDATLRATIWVVVLAES